MKRLSRRQHGFIDYGVGALELFLPRLLAPGPAAGRLLRVSGLNAVLLGAVTRHELGVVKLLPMRAHLALDGVFATVFLAAPFVLRDERPRVRGALAALGSTGALAALLTDPDR